MSEGGLDQAVFGKKDAVDSRGRPIYQGLDTWSFIPTIWSALKKAIEDIEELKGEIIVLQDEINKLKNN